MSVYTLRYEEQMLYLFRLYDTTINADSVLLSPDLLLLVLLTAAVVPSSKDGRDPAVERRMQARRYACLAGLHKVGWDLSTATTKNCRWPAQSVMYSLIDWNQHTLSKRGSFTVSRSFAVV